MTEPFFFGGGGRKFEIGLILTAISLQGLSLSGWRF